MKSHSVSLTYFNFSHGFREQLPFRNLIHKLLSTKQLLQAPSYHLVALAFPGLFFTVFCGSLSNPLILHLSLTEPSPDSPWKEAQCPLDGGPGRNADYVMTTGTACSLQTAHSKDRRMPQGTAGSPVAVGTCFNMFGIMKPASLVNSCNIKSYQTYLANKPNI